MMTFIMAVNIFVLIANAATVGLLFYSTRLQRRAYREQHKINAIQHARITNLERHVLAANMEDAGEVSHHVH
ncbi:MAG TPA: hypothetical protein VK602_17925 [Phyllobacterium sp.]|nr:hypothetical protein [Phyllobacterium sp.]